MREEVAVFRHHQGTDGVSLCLGRHDEVPLCEWFKQQPQIKVPDSVVSAESSLPGLWTAESLLCRHMVGWGVESEREYPLLSPLIDTNPVK